MCPEGCCAIFVGVSDLLVVRYGTVGTTTNLRVQHSLATADTSQATVGSAGARDNLLESQIPQVRGVLLLACMSTRSFSAFLVQEPGIKNSCDLFCTLKDMLFLAPILKSMLFIVSFRLYLSVQEGLWALY